MVTAGERRFLDIPSETAAGWALSSESELSVGLLPDPDRGW